MQLHCRAQPGTIPFQIDKEDPRLTTPFVLVVQICELFVVGLRKPTSDIHPKSSKPQMSWTSCKPTIIRKMMNTQESKELTHGPSWILTTVSTSKVWGGGGGSKHGTQTCISSSKCRSIIFFVHMKSLQLVIERRTPASNVSDEKRSHTHVWGAHCPRSKLKTRTKSLRRKRCYYHWDATLTISRTLPLYAFRETSFPLMSCYKKHSPRKYYKIPLKILLSHWGCQDEMVVVSKSQSFAHTKLSGRVKERKGGSRYLDNEIINVLHFSWWIHGEEEEDLEKQRSCK